MARVVLVTGVSRYLGGRLARRLTEDPTIERVVGVDVVPPRMDIGTTEFVRADIRNPIIAKVIAATSVDTVVHMGVIATPIQAGGRMAMKEINVIGTMQLLAACQKAPTVQRLVVKSTTSVYGAGPRDPALFTERMEPRHPPSSGWGKDSVEVEAYVRGFRRRRPDVTVATLRFANFLGPKVNTSMSSLFTLPVVPTVLGYDARLQFVHEDDGMAAIHQATRSDFTGTVNVAGDGVLMLSQAIRRAGRVGLPVAPPLVSLVGRAVRRAGLADFSPEQVRFLTYGRAVDTTVMRTVFGFEPAFSTVETFDDFVRARAMSRIISPEQAAAAEGTLRSVLTAGGGGRVA